MRIVGNGIEDNPVARASVNRPRDTDAPLVLDQGGASGAVGGISLAAPAGAVRASAERVARTATSGRMAYGRRVPG